MSAKELPDWADGYHDWLSFLTNKNECAGGVVKSDVGSNGTVDSAAESSAVNSNDDEDDVSASSESIESSLSDISKTNSVISLKLFESSSNGSVNSEDSSATSIQKPKAMAKSSKNSDVNSMSNGSVTSEATSATSSQMLIAKVKPSKKSATSNLKPNANVKSSQDVNVNDFFLAIQPKKTCLERNMTIQPKKICLPKILTVQSRKMNLICQFLEVTYFPRLFLKILRTVPNQVW